MYTKNIKILSKIDYGHSKFSNERECRLSVSTDLYVENDCST